MTPWSRSPWSDAGQILAMLDPDANHDSADGKAPPEWYASLRSRNENSEAIMFMAQALPRYECIVWAAQGLLEIGAVDRTDPLMVAVLRWIDSPDDGSRRHAMALATESRRDSPQKLLGMGVAFSGGSLTPPEYPPVQPPPDVCGKMIGGALVGGIYNQPDPAAAIETVLALGEKMVTAQ